jgi:hypothetical protein
MSPWRDLSATNGPIRCTGAASERWKIAHRTVLGRVETTVLFPETWTGLAYSVRQLGILRRPKFAPRIGWFRAGNLPDAYASWGPETLETLRKVSAALLN